MDSLIELKKFYEYKNKLLHATEEFIAYNPLISLPLEMPRTPEYGEQIIKQNFIVGDEMFLAVLSSSLSSGPLSDHKKIESSASFLQKEVVIGTAPIIQKGEISSLMVKKYTCL